jgi:hypothetical protein
VCANASSHGPGTVLDCILSTARPGKCHPDAYSSVGGTIKVEQGTLVVVALTSILRGSRKQLINMLKVAPFFHGSSQWSPLAWSQRLGRAMSFYADCPGFVEDEMSTFHELAVLSYVHLPAANLFVIRPYISRFSPDLDIA